jgi:geranylgeranylglycerol-phosphate geranylgeranyltransferase
MYVDKKGGKRRKKGSIEMKKKDTFYYLIKKSLYFIINWRPIPAYEAISYFLMFASIPMLAYGIQSYHWSIFYKIFLTIIVLYSGFFATLIWNDISDLEIDRVAHPDRPLSSSKISVLHSFTMAVIFSAVVFLFSFLINWMCFFLVVGSASFVTIHNKYLKSRIHLPAYSEIFTPLQWAIVPIFGFLTVEGSSLLNMALLALFTYFTDTAHDIPGGIEDRKGDELKGVSTYATSFGNEAAVKIFLCIFFISGLLGIIIYLRTVLSELFLVLFLFNWGYTFFQSFKLLYTREELPRMAAMIRKKVFNYFLISYDLIFLDMLVQILKYYL